MACPAPAADPGSAHAQGFDQQLAQHLAPRGRAYHEIWLDGEKVEGPDEEPLYGPTYLPRKFKIGVASPGDDCVDAYTQDIGFVAETAGRELAGFRAHRRRDGSDTRQARDVSATGNAALFSLGPTTFC